MSFFKLSRSSQFRDVLVETAEVGTFNQEHDENPDFRTLVLSILDMMSFLKQPIIS
jgi:hypothetical protein